MFEDHQRDEVAVRREILLDGQAIGQLSDVLTLGIVDGWRTSWPRTIRLPKCVCEPCVPVTYQPPQRCASGVLWSTE